MRWNQQTRRCLVDLAIQKLMNLGRVCRSFRNPASHVTISWLHMRAACSFPAASSHSDDAGSAVEGPRRCTLTTTQRVTSSVSAARMQHIDCPRACLLCKVAKHR